MQAVLKDKCTINFWVNEANISNRSVYFGGYSGSNFNIEESSGRIRVYWNANPDITVASSIEANTWIMFTVVINVKTGIKIYKKSTKNFCIKKTTPIKTAAMQRIIIPFFFINNTFFVFVYS